MDLTQLTIAGLRRHLSDTARAALARVGAPDAEVELAQPPDPSMGHLGFPCFALARTLRKAPPLIAKDVAASITPDEVIASVSVDKAYVNLTLRQQALAEVVLREALTCGDRFGADQVDPPQHWMVEYSSPNTNKPLHLGHLRNNLLGAAVVQMLKFFGHRVTSVNLVNDRGIHICKSMLAYQLWGQQSDPQRAGKKGDRLVGDLYVEFERRFAAEYADWQHGKTAAERLQVWLDSPAGQAAQKAADQDSAAPRPEVAFFAQYKDEYFNSESSLGTQARQLLVRWERGDPEVRALWRKMNDWVLAGFADSYARMGVTFDQMQFESDTFELGRQIALDGLEAGLLQRRDDGAVVCDLTRVGLKGEKVLLRSDGTTVYMTQDLGTAAQRVERFHPDKLVYVVGDEQNYHFQVLFKILDLLQRTWGGGEKPGGTTHFEHLGYGMIRLPEGKMKSREGTVVDADDLMDEMHRLARAETQARADEGKAHTEGLSEQELEHRAERIGMAALKYYLLKYSPKTSFEYDPRASIDFLGQTGSYCLFNYARTRSLVRKVGGEPAFAAQAAHRLVSEREQEMVQQLMAWPEVVQRAAEGLDPSRIALYVFELCKNFAYIFTDKANHPIATCDDAQLRDARLMLAVAVGHTIKAGLGVLGIDVLEEM